MVKKIILFELNEVPWRVIDDFVHAQPTSCLAWLLPRLQTFETYAEDTALSPWITWPTLHRGVSDEHHTIADFGQDLAEINSTYPALWEIVRRHGLSTGVCGSLHTYPLPPRVHDYAFYIPDVFAAGSECFPDRVAVFQDFNLRMSRASARNVSAQLPWRNALRVLAAAPGLGLKASTLLDVGKHLLAERRTPARRVRRRTYQVILAFDIFWQQLNRTKPAFSTFFTNHVASSMHRYWAAHYPGDYSVVNYPSEWIATYREEITWTMLRFDRMLERLRGFVDHNPGFALWVATSMGQAATQADAAHTQLYLSDVATFMHRLGFQPHEWEVRPAMLPRVIIAMKNGNAPAFARKLGHVQIAGRGPLPWRQLAHDVFRIHPGALQNVRDAFCVIDGQHVPFAELGFQNVEIEDSAGQSAYHVPQGALLIYDPYDSGSEATTRRRQKIPTTAVAPMLLADLGVPVPSHMRAADLVRRASHVP
jgi:hypothetical protein